MASDKMLGSFDQKSTPEDNDLLVEYDASTSKVKNVKFGGVWKWIVNKLTSAVINKLQTSSKNVVGAINELNSKSIRTKKITELFYFSVTATTGSQYGDFSFYFDEFEYNNDPAISINPIDGVSFVINSFLRNDTTRKINGVLLQARKNGTWLVSTKLSVTGTILGQ